MYPMIKDGVSLGTFSYEGSKDTHYYVENAKGEMFEVGKSLYNSLLEADGTKPLNLPHEGRMLIPDLRRDDIIQTSRFVHCKGVLNRFILFPVKSKDYSSNKLLHAFNVFLPILAAIMLIITICLIKYDGSRSGHGFSWPIYFVLVFVSIAVHEIGHAVAGLCNGYTMKEIGVLLFEIMPIGAYVAFEENKTQKMIAKIQFALAGVEMNILTASIFMILSTVCHSLYITLYAIGIINLLLAAINLLPASGLDGEAALSALCGVDSVYENAKKSFKNRRYLVHLLCSGMAGYLCLLFFSVVLLSNVVVYLCIGFDIAALIFSLQFL